MARKRNAHNAKLIGECPTGCSGRQQSRQRAIMAGEIEQITGKARELVDADPNLTKKCTYCSAVYLQGFSLANPPRLLGHLDGMPGIGWHPKFGLA